MSNHANIVELRPAHTWDCEACGRENFARGIVSELNPEEKRELAEMGQETQTGYWLTAPEEVTCRHCGATFQTREYEEDL